MRPSDGRLSLWPVAIFIMVAIIGAFSIKPTVKLKPDPPPDFLALHASVTPKASIATEYWQVAVRVVQWKYNRTEALPEQVPEEFIRPGDVDKPLSVEDRSARVAYWEKLREEWLRPDSWHTMYSIDVSWFVSGCQTAWHEAGKLF